MTLAICRRAEQPLDYLTERWAWRRTTRRTGRVLAVLTHLRAVAG
jgi:hypothetical protein